MRKEDKMVQYITEWFKDNQNYKYKWANSKFGRTLKRLLVESGNWKKKKRQGVALPEAFIKNQFKSKSAPHLTAKDFEDWDEN